MVENGHFKKLTPEEAAIETDNTWYLPLLAVTSKMKPGKVRLVLDAAAESRGRCLNDYLMRGPDFTNSIPGIICRWREKPIAVTSDVKAMFSQILVRDQDRASLRFLWRGRRRSGPMDTYESQVVIFGAKSSPAIAGYCFRETGKRFGSDLPHVRDAIESGTYVDDIIYSVNTEAEAVRLTEDLTSTLAQGGFELSSWISNSAMVTKTASVDQTSLDDGVTLDMSDSHRTLGTVWKPKSDVMTYRAQMPTPSPPTKRTILSVVMSVFDPLGYLAGWLLPVKKTLQNMWAQKRGWEDEPDGQGRKTWDEWTHELSLIGSVEVPRHMFDHEAGVTSVEVHAFCDASTDGFSAVVYYRWTSLRRSQVCVSFVAARCRLSPLKTLSIPRLELQAAVLATRLVCSLRKESRLVWSSVTYWSDSKNVLAWIQAQDRRYHVFVSNRTAEILDKSSADQWRYVPTALNPADGGSRGHRLPDLRPDGVWASGPNFLHKSVDHWPEELDTSPQDILQDDPETKTVFAVSSVQPPTPDIRHSLPELTRFSRWSTAVRTVCLILRWRNRARKHQAQEATGANEPLELEAEILLMKLAQKDAYAAEMRDLEACVPLDSKSPLKALTVVLMRGLICLDSRARRSPDMSTSAKFPVILPRGHPYTQLLIQHLHEKMAHRAHDAVLVELRQRCWVPQAAREIRKVVSRCQVCKIRKAKPTAPQMAPLPLPRVTMLGGAFRAVGLDFFGPMQITRGRATVKIWGALFRCMATKAIHIELTESLDTEATLMVISRFQARRGNVKEIWSDNAGSFKSANKELRHQFARLDQQKISAKLGLDGIAWRFSPPADPEAGGVWERSIRTVKETLRIILKERRPRFEVLYTLICEVEKILNSTPLFHVPVDPDDEEPLTPFHFLIGRPSPSYPSGTPIDDNVDLRRRWKHAQTLADHFWKRWVREYLPTLAERPKWKKSGRNLEIGDVVIIVDPQSPRGLWPRGIVEEVMRAEDGHVRSALVRTKHGVLHRPARKLAVLDVIRTGEC